MFGNQNHSNSVSADNTPLCELHIQSNTKKGSQIKFRECCYTITRADCYKKTWRDKPLKALFFLYEGYVDWEISILSYILNVTGVEINTTALNDEVTHKGAFKVKLDINIEACNPNNYDALIIPGGEPDPFIKDEQVLNLVREFDDQGKVISAICGGTTFLAAAGVLRERKYSTSIDDDLAYKHYFNEAFKSETDVTVCENLITAEGNAYVEFAVAVGKRLGIFKDREDELETVLFFKNQLRG